MFGAAEDLSAAHLPEAGAPVCRFGNAPCGASEPEPDVGSRLRSESPAAPQGEAQGLYEASGMRQEAPDPLFPVAVAHMIRSCHAEPQGSSMS